MIQVPDGEASVIAETVTSVTRPGATLTGAQRRHVAEVSRGEVTSDGGPLDELTVQLTTAAHTIRADTARELAERGVDSARYTEVLGIVSRLRAVDTMCFGLGAAPAPLPQPVDGPPTGIVDDSAVIDGGWIPTVGAAWPTTALSALPSEQALWETLHSQLYLTMAGMADLDADRGLHRTQIELVAARTSLLNECFF